MKFLNFAKETNPKSLSFYDGKKWIDGLNHLEVGPNFMKWEGWLVNSLVAQAIFYGISFKNGQYTFDNYNNQCIPLSWSL